MQKFAFVAFLQWSAEVRCVFDWIEWIVHKTNRKCACFETWTSHIGSLPPPQDTITVEFHAETSLFGVRDPCIHVSLVSSVYAAVQTFRIVIRLYLESRKALRNVQSHCAAVDGFYNFHGCEKYSCKTQTLRHSNILARRVIRSLGMTYEMRNLA